MAGRRLRARAWTLVCALAMLGALLAQPPAARAQDGDIPPPGPVYTRPIDEHPIDQHPIDQHPIDQHLIDSHLVAVPVTEVPVVDDHPIEGHAIDFQPAAKPHPCVVHWFRRVCK